MISSTLLRSLLPNIRTTKRHTERRVLRGITPEKLFSVIIDVNRYQEFLPLCFRSQIQERTRMNKHKLDSLEKEEFDAFLKIGITLPSSIPAHLLPVDLSEEYVSRVKVDPFEMCVETSSVDGSVKNELFDSIRSGWKLRDIHALSSRKLDDPCPHEVGVEVEFDVEICVSNPVVAGVLDHVLQEVAGRQVKAFDERCRWIDDNGIGQDFR